MGSGLSFWSTCKNSSLRLSRASPRGKTNVIRFVVSSNIELICLSGYSLKALELYEVMIGVLEQILSRLSALVHSRNKGGKVM